MSACVCSGGWWLLVPSCLLKIILANQLRPNILFIHIDDNNDDDELNGLFPYNIFVICDPLTNRQKEKKIHHHQIDVRGVRLCIFFLCFRSCYKSCSLLLFLNEKKNFFFIEIFVSITQAKIQTEQNKTIQKRIRQKGWWWFRKNFLKLLPAKKKIKITSIIITMTCACVCVC